MNVTLGSGKAVHAAHVAADGEVQNFPTCGGNKAGERYASTGREVTCKKCLKKLAAERHDLGYVHPVMNAPAPKPLTQADLDAMFEVPEVTEVEVTETVIELDMVEPTKGFVAISGHGVVGTVLHTERRGGARGDGWAAEDEDGIEAVSRTWDKARAATLLARHLGFEGPLRVRVNREYSNA